MSQSILRFIPENSLRGARQHLRAIDEFNLGILRMRILEDLTDNPSQHDYERDYRRNYEAAARASSGALARFEITMAAHGLDITEVYEALGRTTDPKLIPPRKR